MQEFNLGLDTIVEFLQKNGSPIDRSPVAKLTEAELALLRKEYSSSAQEKKEASGISIGHKHHEKIVIEGDSHKDRRRNTEEEMDEAADESDEEEILDDFREFINSINPEDFQG